MLLPRSTWAELSPAAGVKAESARSEGDHLQKTASHRDVLEEMDELVLVGEVIVECERRGDREHSKQRGRDAGLVTDDQGQTATDLDRYGDRISDPRVGKARRGNIANGEAGRCELGRPESRKIAAIRTRPITVMKSFEMLAGTNWSTAWLETELDMTKLLWNGSPGIGLLVYAR